MKIYFIFKLTTFSLSAKCATKTGNENKCVSRKNRCWNLRLLSLAHGVWRQQWNLAFPVEAGRDYIQRRQHSFKSNTSLLRVVRRRQWLMCLTHFDYYSISFEWLVNRDFGSDSEESNDVKQQWVFVLPTRYHLLVFPTNFWVGSPKCSTCGRETNFSIS